MADEMLKEGIEGVTDETVAPDHLPEPEFDPAEWEQKREEKRAADVEPYTALRQQIDDYDEILAEVLYENTLLKIGEEE